MRVALITPDRVDHPFVMLIIEGLRALGVEFFASDPGSGLTAAEVVGNDEWVTRARDVDAIFVFFGKEGSLAAGPPPTRAPKRYLLDDGHPTPIAYLDYSEMTASGKPKPGQVEAMRTDPTLRQAGPWLDLEMYERTDAGRGAYFKRECFADDAQIAGLIPLAFGMLDRYVTPIPRYGKDWDLLCCFGHTRTGLRQEIVAEVRRLAGKHRDRKIVVKERLNPREYREALARSKVVIDAWGHGDHCYRIWEAAGAQACILYQRYQVLTGPDWFEEGREALSFATMREFTEHAEALLADRERALVMGRRGHELALAKHTGRARVEYILRKLGVV